MHVLNYLIASLIPPAHFGGVLGRLGAVLGVWVRVLIAFRGVFSEGSGATPGPLGGLLGGSGGPLGGLLEAS